MIVEDKTNIYDAIIQIVQSHSTNVELYTRTGVVRGVNDDDTYDVELTNELFDFDVPNTDNYLYSVENVTENTIQLKSYVYVTYITNDIAVIFNSETNDEKIIYATNLASIGSKELTFTSDDGGVIEVRDKIKIENNSYNLKELLGELITEIQKITVPTPSGTSGVPLNVASLSIINSKIKALLE